MVGRNASSALNVVPAKPRGPAPARGRRDDDVLQQRLRSMLRRPGSALSERSLAEELGITRHRLRLTLARLRAAGEIVLPVRQARLPRREAMIRATNPVEVVELRLALEPALARLAAMRATPLDIVQIERAATTASGQDQGSADLAFHRLIAASTGNALARDIYGLLRGVGADVRLRVAPGRPSCPNRVRQRDAEHRAVAAAIAARDPDAAEAAMRAHLTVVRQRILDSLTPGVSVA